MRANVFVDTPCRLHDHGWTMTKEIVVTTSVYGSHSDAIGTLERAGFKVDRGWIGRDKKPTSGELRELLARFDGVLAGTEPFYDEGLFKACPRLKFVSRVGIGLDGIDFAAAARHGVEIAYTPDAVTRPVAEFTLGLILGIGRRIALADRGIRAGVWKRHIGPELAGRTAGIIGYGRVGRLVAEQLRALGMVVLANDILPDHAHAARIGATFSDKDRIFREADVISLHVPHTPQTHHLINHGTLGLMKRTALVVNTSRGQVVDVAALIEALETGGIGGAALDVYDEEPYRGPLTALDNVLLTCHMGSCSDLGRRRMEEESAHNLIAFFQGKTDFGRVPDELRG